MIRSAVHISVVIATAITVSTEPTSAHDGENEAATLLTRKGCRVDGDGPWGGPRVIARRAKLEDADMELVAQIANLEAVHLGNSPVGDRGMKSISSAQTLVTLIVNGTNITDAGMIYIARLKHLKSVSLPSSVTDKGIHALRGHPSLESISCRSHEITDESVDALLTLGTLKRVSFGPNVTPAGYERLSVLPDIERISVDSDMDDDIMAVLAKFPKLTSLSLAHTRVTDAGLPQLRRLENLQYLTLPTDTTDAGLAHVAHMRKLQQLDLRETRVTSDGLAALKDVRSLNMLALPATTGDRAVAILAEHQVPVSTLSLPGPEYTNACIATLISMKRVRNVAFGLKTNVTPEGIKRLKSARPEMEIHFWPQSRAAR